MLFLREEFSLLFKNTFFVSDHLTQDLLPLSVLRKIKLFDWHHFNPLLTRGFYCRSCILLVTPLFGCPLILLKGYTSPEGSASSLTCYTPLTDSNIRTAAKLWVASATSTYGPVYLWGLSQVTSLANVWCGYDATTCGSAFMAMRSFNGDISVWDVSLVTSMYRGKPIHIFDNEVTWREHAIAIEWIGGVM
jgi:hypothetical protein